MALTQNELKRAVAQAAVAYVKEGEILGVGTGSTVDFFIDAIAPMRDRIPACVSSSERSTKKLEGLGFKVLDMNEVDRIGVYVDGADEIDGHFAMIKGGGGALTREKIVASVSKRFVCIADASKKVEVLGRFPLPVEVIPMAARAVRRRLEALGATVKLRDFVTDNGCHILLPHSRRGRAPDRRPRSARSRDQLLAGRRHRGALCRARRGRSPPRNGRGREDL